MECIEARALKSSCFSRFAMVPSSNLPTTNFTCGDGDDDFSVDEFFDLPADEQGQTSLFHIEEEDEGKDHSSYTVSLSSSSHDLNRHLDDGHSNSSSSSSSSSSTSAQAQDLCFPVCPVTGDMEELELWSQLMDDSISEEISLADQILKSGLHAIGRSEPDKKPVAVAGSTPCVPAALPVWPWKNRLQLQVRHSGGGSTPSTTMPINRVRGRKKKWQVATAVVQPRRCTHCQVQRTPQWRAGPLGPKTLCNACGVRFKKGRLYPEYRPACSPTFSSGIHSNSHRKVMEMRRRREMVEPVERRSGSMAE